MSASRSPILVAAVVALLSVVAVLAVLVIGNRRQGAFDPDTPQGALQRYLAEWEDGDWEAAYGRFSSTVRARMSLDELEQAGEDPYDDGASRSRRVLFENADIDGNSAVVDLTVEEFSADGLSGSTYRSPRTIRMIREGGMWLIDEPLAWLDPAPYFGP